MWRVKGSISVTFAVAAALALAGCGSSSGSHAASTHAAAKHRALAKIQKDEACLKASSDYVSLDNDLQGVKSSNASPSAYSQVVAGISNFSTDPTVIRAYGNPTQQAEVDQLRGVLSQLSAGMKAGAAGNLVQGVSDLTGVAPQMAKMEPLVTSICGT